MGFRLLLLTTGLQGQQGGATFHEDWPARLRATIPDIAVDVAHSTEEAMELVEEADAAYGFIVPAVFERAKGLRWIACPQAGPPAGYYHQALIDSDVVVTNTREIYNDHISAHIMSYVLAFARGLHVYIRQQAEGQWAPGYEPVHLPDSTAVVVGLGGIGAETARLCSEFGMTVIGVDDRRLEAPAGVAKLHGQSSLMDVLPRGDFVVVTVPETPDTRGMFSSPQFRAMSEGAFFINIGRGATVVLDDLDAALREGQVRGAALDVFQIEPLPPSHPLWTAPNMLVTPHVAGVGPYLDERRTELFIQNCVRFDEGRPLRNVVDKAKWF